jgi:L-amino acid N-acyltransferase YncA
MAVKIRPIVLKDAASYRRCRDTVAKERRYSYEYKAPPLSEVRVNLRKHLRKKTPFLVAMDGERVVGWAAVYRAGVPALSHGGDLVLGLLSEHRGMGLGTKLAAGVLKTARGKFDMVILTVFRKNKRARKFFERMGFKSCGAEKNAVKLAYGFDDVLIMQKQTRR